MKAENLKLKQSCYYLKRKNSLQENALNDFKAKVESLTKDLTVSKNVLDSLKKCTSEIPAKLFELTAKRAKGSRIREYDPSIRKFALTLQMASSKAYRLLRKEFEDALPGEPQIRRWCSRNIICLMLISSDPEKAHKELNI